MLDDLEKEEESTLSPEEMVEPKRGPGRPLGSKNKPKDEDPEAPPMLTSTDEPRKKRGRPFGSKNKTASKSPKMPIPPNVIRAMGGAPYLLAGQLYGMRTGRNLDFTNPDEVKKMYEASLTALEAWLAESGVEAPAWLVYAGTTASCIGFAMAVDQAKLKAEKELGINSRGIKPPNNVKPSSAGAGPAQRI